MKRKGWIILAGIVVLAFVIAYFVSPIIAFRSLAEAAQTGDRGRLERLIDFPAVRENLKEQLRTRLLGALAQDRSLTEGPFGQLGALLGPAIVDQVVNVAVTPEGVAAMVRSGRAPMANVGGGAVPPPEAAGAIPPAEPANAAVPAEPQPKTQFSFDDVNHFRATMTRPEQPDASLGWIMERRGLFAWKLVGVELPPA